MARKCSVCKEKYASFARAGAEKPLRCGGCRVAGDVNVVSKRCGCGKRPVFGPVGGKKVHCAGCRVEGDVDLMNKMCSTCNEVRANFAPPGRRRTRCAGCRLRGDVNVCDRMCSGCPKRAYFGPAGGRAHRCADCRIEGDVDVLSDLCTTCLAVSASYGTISEGPRRCAGCRLPGDVNKNKSLCRTCYKNVSEYGPTPRKKPNTCSTCRTRGQLHRDSDWLWNMLVTRKPRKGKKHKILWSKETLRDQLWWLKPQKKVKTEVKQEVKVEPQTPGSATSPAEQQASSSRHQTPGAGQAYTTETTIKAEPGAEGKGRR
jgi:hypothetical protein